MRIALGLVAALAGCNQIWGNDPVVRWDAPVGEGPPEAPLPTARLELLVATTDNNGAATNAVITRPLDPAPTVQVGRIDGPLSPTTYDAGAVTIPAEFPGTPWRLVFTPAGDVPHEVHWAPAVGEGRAAVVQFGGIDREPVPANASYRLQPAGTFSYTDIRAYTTGVWAVGQPTASGTVATQPVTPSALKVISGPLLAPDPAKGDRVVLVDYAGTLPCLQAKGSAVFAIPLTGPDSTQQPAPSYFQNQGGGVNIDITQAAYLRMVGRFAPSAGYMMSHAMYGLAASTVMPAFVTNPLAAPLRGPAMIPLIRCIALNPGDINDPGTQLTGDKAFGTPVLDTAVLPPIAHLQLFTPRGLPSGALTYSGMAAMNATDVASKNFVFDFQVGIPIDIALGGQSLAGADGVALTPGSGPLELTFALDEMAPGVPGVADYVTATLYRATSPIVREREYTFTGTSLLIDRAVLAPQTEYVIELRTYVGAPGAAAGDFTRYAPLQSSASRITATFITP
ncbi:MAG TPA: hypothetical protein VM513_02310 [Kofleriaceae bacterium]|jgi:hypothetical protein|nr:hypothetical protein [Kofleriaceae bacterium]